MYIFPAIDLYEGKAVRLQRGDYNKMTVYSDNPVELGYMFADAGAQFLHFYAHNIVDMVNLPADMLRIT